MVRVLMDEVVQRHQGFFQALLVNLETISAHFVVAYPGNATTGAHARSFLVPFASDFPSLTGLCKGRARIGDFPTLAQDCESVKDV